MSGANEVYDRNHPKNKFNEEYMKEQYKRLGIPWRDTETPADKKKK